MPKLYRQVGIVTVSRKPVTRWATRGFAPHSVLPDVPKTAPGERLSPPGDVEFYYAGAFQVMLHSGETGHYRDNLLARPSLWVAMRPDRAEGVTLVTADPTVVTTPAPSDPMMNGIGAFTRPVRYCTSR